MSAQLAVVPDRQNLAGDVDLHVVGRRRRLAAAPGRWRPPWRPTAPASPRRRPAGREGAGRPTPPAWSWCRSCRRGARGRSGARAGAPGGPGCGGPGCRRPGLRSRSTRGRGQHDRRDGGRRGRRLGGGRGRRLGGRGGRRLGGRGGRPAARWSWWRRARPWARHPRSRRHPGPAARRRWWWYGRPGPVWSSRLLR